MGNTASGTGPQFFILGAATFVATYTNIDSTSQTAPHVISGTETGNINANPLFMNVLLPEGADGKWMTADDGLQLQSNSPCVDAGDTTGVTLFDILSQNRTFNFIIDMGAYEFSSITTAVQDNEQSKNIVSVYPNPANSIVSVRFNALETENASLQLFDFSGRLISTVENSETTKVERSYQIDISGLENGIYLLHINTASGKYSQKLLKN